MNIKLLVFSQACLLAIFILGSWAISDVWAFSCSYTVADFIPGLTEYWAQAIWLIFIIIFSCGLAVMAYNQPGDPGHN